MFLEQVRQYLNIPLHVLGGKRVAIRDKSDDDGRDVSHQRIYNIRRQVWPTIKAHAAYPHTGRLRQRQRTTRLSRTVSHCLVFEGRLDIFVAFLA